MLVNARLVSLLVFFICVLLCQISLAASILPYKPRLQLDGTASDFGLIAGDSMMPVIGNEDWIGYLDAAGRYGNDQTWYGSAGVGFRKVAGDFLWGAYIFTDRNVSAQHNIFWILNPAVEFMTEHFDARINGYVSVSNSSKSIGIFSANQIGLNSRQFSGHQQILDLYNINNVVGNGLDTEIRAIASKLV